MTLEYVRLGKNYRNIKKQTIYRAVLLGMDSERDGETMVAYVEPGNWWHRLGLWFINLGVNMMKDSGHHTLFWFRPLTLFEEKFEEVE